MSPLCGRKSDIRLCRPDCGVATTGSVQDQTVSAERGEGVSGVGQHIDIDTLHALHDD